MTQTRWLSPHQQHVWRAFLQASHHLWDQLDHDLQHTSSLPLAYYQTLAMLSEAPDRTLRMSDLAARTFSSRSRLSHAVDRLEEKGWVRRVSCPSDRRGAFAQLTDEGYDVLVAAAPTHVESVQCHLFDPLGPDLVDALGQISAAIIARLDSPASDGDGGGDGCPGLPEPDQALTRDAQTRA